MNTVAFHSLGQPPLVAEAAEFLATAFPEHAFPPVEGTSDPYRRACRRGYARMAQSRVAITGLARNLGGILPLTIQRIETLAGCFADHRVIVFENDSTDDTRDVLRRWEGTNGRVKVVCEDLRDPVNPSTRCPARAERMADYRRRCQDRVLASCRGFNFTIIVDLDILGGWSVDGVANTFGHDGWDFVGANGLVVRRRGLAVNHVQQYDTWALRFDPDLTPLSTVEAAGIVYGRGAPLVRVTSCFGGLGIYAMDAYAAGRYATDDLEHATFHRSMIAAGHDRLFLNPSQLVVYGRRHRFGDRAVELLLGGWSFLTGRRRPPTLFRPGEVPASPTVPRLERAAA